MTFEVPSKPEQKGPGDQADGPQGENPRAFATATGFVFQIVGLLLTLGGCCTWSLSGWFQSALSGPVKSTADYLQDPATTIGMAGMVCTFLAGIGLLASGMGLQAEHPRSGAVALAASGLLAITGWGCCGGMIWAGGSAVSILVGGFLAILGTVLFLLAGNSARVLRLHPAPADRNVVTDEFLESTRRQRH